MSDILQDAAYNVYRLITIGSDESGDEDYFEEPTEDNDYAIPFEFRDERFVIRIEEA